MASRWSAWLFDLWLTVDPAAASRYRYRRVTGKTLDLDAPRDFNEKLQWLKLYWQHPLIAQCGDKYEFRAYVESCGCQAVLNPLWGVYDRPDEIDWAGLPQKFALKCTHGCGFNVICDDKDRLDRRQTLDQLGRWLKIRYGRYAAEVHYSYMQPRIICEKYIETSAGLLPNDYKLYCCNGEPIVTLICSERQTAVRYDYADNDWQRLDLGDSSYYSDQLPQRPGCHAAMIEYARILSRPFPFVRLDFYDDNGAPVLGEMTFTPGAAMAICYKDSGLRWIGDRIKLPERYPKRFS